MPFFEPRDWRLSSDEFFDCTLARNLSIPDFSTLLRTDELFYLSCWLWFIFYKCYLLLRVLLWIRQASGLSSHGFNSMCLRPSFSRVSFDRLPIQPFWLAFLAMIGSWASFERLTRSISSSSSSLTLFGDESAYQVVVTTSTSLASYNLDNYLSSESADWNDRWVSLMPAPPSLTILTGLCD